MRIAYLVMVLGKTKYAIEVVKNNDLLKGRDRDTLQTILKKVENYRNAFAHGHLKHINDKGVVLTCYSGSSKSDLLDDQYWTVLEDAFKQANGLLNKANNCLDSKTIAEVNKD